MKTMRRLAGVAVVIGLAVLSALVTPAEAATMQVSAPFTVTVMNPCNGEAVYVTGVMHAVMIANDNKVETQTNYQGTTGVALLTGTLYQVNDALHVFITPVSSSTVVTFGIHDSMELVTTDPSSNFLYHQFIEFTVDFSSDTVDVRMTGQGADCSGTPAT